MQTRTNPEKVTTYESVIVNHPVYGLTAQIRITDERVVCTISQASEEEIKAMTDALNALGARTLPQ